MEESFEFGKGCFGLDQCQARLYTAILRHIVLVMAALAICAVTAAMLRDRTDTQAPPPAAPPMPRRPPTPASSRSPSPRSEGCSPTRPGGPNRPATAARMHSVLSGPLIDSVSVLSQARPAWPDRGLDALGRQVPGRRPGACWLSACE